MFLHELAYQMTRLHIQPSDASSPAQQRGEMKRAAHSHPGTEEEQLGQAEMMRMYVKRLSHTGTYLL